MNSNVFNILFTDLWDDVRNPAIAWQLGVLCVCVILGWYMARLWRKSMLAPNEQFHSLSMVKQSFIRLLTPVLILVLVVIAKTMMARWQAVNLLRLAIPLIGSVVLIRIVFFLLRSIFSRAGRVGANLLLFEKLFALLVWCGVALYITGSWPELLDFFDETKIPLGRHKVTLSSIFQAVISVAVMLMAALWVGAEIESRLMKMDGLHSSLRVVAARTVRACLILVAVLLSLSMVGIDLTVLSVFGGALGVGIGLGLQKIASSYVSGFVILLDRSLKIGDMIKVDQFSGKVTHINTRYTVLQGLDGTETIVPNEMLVSGVVQNFSLSNTVVRVGVRISVAYSTDVESLLPLMEQVASTVPRVLHDPEPNAMLVNFGDSGVDLELGFWINDPENGRLGVSSDVNRAVWKLFKEMNIEIPFPQREVKILENTQKG